ncbi:putative membrane protein, required for colicin V production [Terriglobus roseus DSM 18391]|uniref:Putative membrane protein, required for colicin V production n=1 Tax=Terriglobus roseus (strain DSM 18391 / NRRL B-41598 / KBS 63) TaxID=926566 RepID=I3ZFR8_TERRK|nr:CvpA family protein [Terriglobus roseus]AFL88086.1 putative membrane protein, required for colicin V production [Terriglobus roseus DSM 18391]
MNNTLHGVTIGLNGMNPLDWTIALVLAISVVTAFMRGLIRSVVSLAGLLAGILAACWYAPKGAAYLARWVTPFAFAEIVAFVLILAGVYVLAALLGRVLSGAAGAVGLGFLDRLGGACFGFVRGVLLLASLVLPFGPFLHDFRAAKDSVLLPYLLPAAHGISFVVPRDFGKRLPASDWWNHARSAAGELAPIGKRTTPSD